MEAYFPRACHRTNSEIVKCEIVVKSESYGHIDAKSRNLALDKGKKEQWVVLTLYN